MFLEMQLFLMYASGNGINHNDLLASHVGEVGREALFSLAMLTGVLIKFFVDRCFIHFDTLFLAFC